MKRSPITCEFAEERLSRRLEQRSCVWSAAFVLSWPSRPVSGRGHARLPNQCGGGICALQGVSRMLPFLWRCCASGTADQTNVHPPLVSWRKRLVACSVASVTSRQFGVGTGVEPVTSRSCVWCSTTELTDIDAFRLDPMFGTHAPNSAALCRALPVAGNGTRVTAHTTEPRRATRAPLDGKGQRAYSA